MSVETHLAQLLSEVGLTTTEWEAYIGVLQNPNAAIDRTERVVTSLVGHGLLRTSVERDIGYAPIPPRLALSRIIEQHERTLLAGVSAGIQLRRLLRSVSGPDEAGSTQSIDNGIEIYASIREARDRLYDLTLRSPTSRKYNLESRSRNGPAHRAAAIASSDPTDEASDRTLFTYVADRFAAKTPWYATHYSTARRAGETVLRYAGTLEPMILTKGSHFALWLKPHPSTAATVIITAPWAVALAEVYVDLVVSMSEPWASDAYGEDGLEVRVGDLLSHGLTDGQIAKEVGASPRTVGRVVAKLLLSLGASSRFEAGVLLERRRQVQAELDNFQ